MSRIELGILDLLVGYSSCVSFQPGKQLSVLLMTVKMGDHSLMSAANADGFVLGQGWVTIAKSKGSAL